MTAGTNRDSNLVSSRKCIILPFKEKYQFSEDSIPNILLLANMADNYHITIDTLADHVFHAHF